MDNIKEKKKAVAKRFVIHGKYGDYEVTPEQHKSYEKARIAREHKSMMGAVKKEFPRLKLNGKSPF